MTIATLITLAIWIIIVGLVVGILYWIITSSPLPEPFKTWGGWAILAIGALVLLYKLVSLLGGI